MIGMTCAVEHCSSLASIVIPQSTRSLEIKEWDTFADLKLMSDEMMCVLGLITLAINIQKRCVLELEDKGFFQQIIGIAGIRGVG
jgi:hypothetical protein